MGTEVILKQIIDKLNVMDTKLSGLENKIDGMGRRLDAVFEQRQPC